ncbi:hypothetical protein GLIP_1361 [Aliiglaciecola lipolytica E3]|uniref:Uncharacterized protein n=1 Tax=Aliiglaciecola lipolytica E3 TaxID=1127673 RepID=K6Y705_9ALTE|nr:hypothetical protein GLIP_1361 [Aliiglaciecola lipolytica E3]
MTLINDLIRNSALMLPTNPVLKQTVVLKASKYCARIGES